MAAAFTLIQNRWRKLGIQAVVGSESLYVYHGLLEEIWRDGPDDEGEAVVDLQERFERGQLAVCHYPYHLAGMEGCSLKAWLNRLEPLLRLGWVKTETIDTQDGKSLPIYILGTRDTKDPDDPASDHLFSDPVCDQIEAEISQYWLVHGGPSEDGLYTSEDPCWAAMQQIVRKHLGAAFLFPNQARD